MIMFLDDRDRMYFKIGEVCFRIFYFPTSLIKRQKLFI
jgi:hypothetical protein